MPQTSPTSCAAPLCGSDFEKKCLIQNDISGAPTYGYNTLGATIEKGNSVRENPRVYGRWVWMTDAIALSTQPASRAFRSRSAGWRPGGRASLRPGVVRELVGGRAIAPRAFPGLPIPNPSCQRVLAWLVCCPAANGDGEGAGAPFCLFLSAFGFFFSLLLLI